jgi:hypothetical protein
MARRKRRKFTTQFKADAARLVTALGHTGRSARTGMRGEGGRRLCAIGGGQRCVGTTTLHTSSGAPSSRTRFPTSATGSRGTPLPKSVRLTARGRVVVLDRQRALGALQLGRWLSARLPRWELRCPQAPARARPWRGHLDHVGPACPCIRPVPRGPVNREALRPASAPRRR